MSRGRARASRPAAVASRLASEYGMLGVLLLLVLLFSILTLRPQEPSGSRAAADLFRRIEASAPQGRPVCIVGRAGEEDARFAADLAGRLRKAGRPVSGILLGDPAVVREGLERIAAASGASADGDPALGDPGGRDRADGDQADGGPGDGASRWLVATTAAQAPVVRGVLQDLGVADGSEVWTAEPYRWPTFLLRDNLLNVASQIAVIAVVAVGMTLVILTGGIDLSVGSLIALAAVIVAGLTGWMGGEAASGGAMFAAGVGAVLACGAIGAFSGLVITRFAVPPFIATLGMMQVASGIAYILSDGRPIYRLPERFVALGRGADPLLGIPFAVLLMAGLFAGAHLLMSRTVFGRHVYAVGGNAEAARLAGVRVKGVLLAVYAGSGLLAGLGGVITASQLRSGAPTYGLMYELYVIAAVVVGGTSLSGGEGKVLGTLIGAFIIAVIQNGMNLTNVESYTQKVVLGLVILGAVLLDRLKHQGWRRPRGGARSTPAAQRCTRRP